ncbi:hypothetical protein HYX08_04010 [Candidatus Woesearchaeota archaeon]|nr:hypothetical protein [Candidatus Woesearchaeota archaeon]
MRLKLKSQVTMLLIVGLVIFIAISLALYLSKSAVRKQSQQNIKRTQDAAAEVQPIKEFAAKCIDKLAKDAIILLGRQGGYIYASQGGTLVDYQDTDEGIFFANHNNFKVAYNILPPKFAVAPYASDAPDYPWAAFPYRTAASNAEIFDGFFGISNMPPLNSSEGPNSIQVQIESFIDKNMESCANLEPFEKQGLEIEVQPSKTEVTIGSGDVSIRTKMPITIRNPATNELAEMNEFSANAGVRLRDLYFFSKELIENDIKNIKFDISDAKNSKDFFEVKTRKNEISNDDIIIVEDAKSLVYGKPLEYIFARRNRMPALYYIRKGTLEFPHNFEIKQDDLLDNYRLKAEDPDEDNITFTITPSLPKKLEIPQINFRVEASDGSLSDYQTVTVNRI